MKLMGKTKTVGENLSPCHLKGKRTLLQARCGPEGGYRYSSTLPLPRHLKGLSGQQHFPAALYSWERPGTHCTGGWVGPRAGLDRRKISPQPGFLPQTVQPVVSRYPD
jgi:hypothetical protein